MPVPLAAVTPSLSPSQPATGPGSEPATVRLQLEGQVEATPSPSPPARARRHYYLLVYATMLAFKFTHWQVVVVLVARASVL